MRFVKGHGTENDFVVVPDLDGELDLTPTLVAALCDRRAGLGADGVLRAVRTALVPEVAAQADQAQWCMDLRNADGSLAEMSGNGMRVFARYLAEVGLVALDEPLVVATRGGPRPVRFEDDGRITVDMGVAELPDVGPLRVQVGANAWPALAVQIPNPHAVAFVDDLDQAGDLVSAPVITPATAFPLGVNVEFVVARGAGQAAMRVFERGVGETRSCGTGASAVAVAAGRRDHAVGSAYTVDVPGGQLTATERADGHVELTGPAILVATGTVDEEWLAQAAARRLTGRAETTSVRSSWAPSARVAS